MGKTIGLRNKTLDPMIKEIFSLGKGYQIAVQNRDYNEMNLIRLEVQSVKDYLKCYIEVEKKQIREKYGDYE